MPEVKDIPLQWIRVNFNKHSDKAQDEIESETTLAPVDWYEDLDSNLKVEYNQKVLEKIIPTFQKIFTLTPEEEIIFREKYKNTDFTGLIKSPTAAHEFHQHLLNTIVDTIGDYRFKGWKEKREIQEAAIGFKPDTTSKAKSQVKLIMGNLEQALKYLEGNAFVKSYDNETLSTIKGESDKAMDALNSLMQTIDTTPDAKKGRIGFREEEIKFSKKEMEKLHKDGKLKKGEDTYEFNEGENIKLKNYKPLSEIDLDRTWRDTFGKEKGDRLAKKQHDLNNDPV